MVLLHAFLDGCRKHSLRGSFSPGRCGRVGLVRHMDRSRGDNRGNGKPSSVLSLGCTCWQRDPSASVRKNEGWTRSSTVGTEQISDQRFVKGIDDMSTDRQTRIFICLRPRPTNKPRLTSGYKNMCHAETYEKTVNCVRHTNLMLL